MFKSKVSKPPNYLINKYSTKTCFKSYNRMRAQGFKFGAYYLMKVDRNRSIFVKVISQKNSQFVEPKDQSIFNRKNRNFQRVLDNRLKVVLLGYCGYSFKRLTGIYKRMKSEEQNKPSINECQRPENVSEEPEMDDYQKDEIVEVVPEMKNYQKLVIAEVEPQMDDYQKDAIVEVKPQIVDYQKDEIVEVEPQGSGYQSQERVIEEPPIENLLPENDVQPNFNYSTINNESVNCDFCNASFPGTAELQVHLTEYHYECEICFRIFGCRRNLVQHMKSHNHGVGHYSCYCLMKFHNTPSLRYHLVKEHGATEFLCCTNCPKAFETQSQFNFHKRIHMTENVPCSLCYTILKSPVHLKLHQRNIHGMAVFPFKRTFRKPAASAIPVICHGYNQESS